jgi:D-aminopeptidase
MRLLPPVLALVLLVPAVARDETPRARLRDHGLTVGVLPPGARNAITDVAGVAVGQVTLNDEENVRTGVTAVVPHPGSIFRDKPAAAVHVGNGFGKLTGLAQVRELGTLETPIVLTNTLDVWTAAAALVDWTLARPGNEQVRSVNPVVGETNDGRLHDIRGHHVQREHVLAALATATDGPVAEGAVGAGTGTVAFGFKGGIGTSSRRLPDSLGGHTVGVLVQTNFGGVLRVAGVPVGERLGQHYLADELSGAPDGSCMIVVATDAPVHAPNLERMASRAMLGLARTGGIASNGSGDFVIAFSTHPAVRTAHASDARTKTLTVLRDDAMSPLFLATIEATEEAILNSLFMARTTTGANGTTVPALPAETVVEWVDQARGDAP